MLEKKLLHEGSSRVDGCSNSVEGVRGPLMSTDDEGFAVWTPQEVDMLQVAHHFSNDVCFLDIVCFGPAHVVHFGWMAESGLAANCSSGCNMLNMKVCKMGINVSVHGAAGWLSKQPFIGA